MFLMRMLSVFIWRIGDEFIYYELFKVIISTDYMETWYLIYAYYYFDAIQFFVSYLCFFNTYDVACLTSS